MEVKYSVVKLNGKLQQIENESVVNVTKKQFIGLKVKEALEAKGWTQTDLVNMSQLEADEVPYISASYLSEIINGKTKGNLGLDYLAVMASLLGKKMEYFLPKEA